MKSDTIDYLKKIPPFSDLSQESVDGLEEYIRHVVYPSGEIIFEAGDDGESLYIIKEGEVQIYIEDRDDGERIVLSQLGVGDYFGEMALITGEPRSASVMTLTHVSLLQLEKKGFEKLIRDNPQISLAMSKRLSQRLQKSNIDRIESEKQHHAQISPSGKLEENGLDEVIRFCEHNSLTGTVRVDHGVQHGYIRFSKGIVQDVRLGELQDAEAMDQMLQWPRGNFVIEPSLFSIEEPQKRPVLRDTAARSPEPPVDPPIITEVVNADREAEAGSEKPDTGAPEEKPDAETPSPEKISVSEESRAGESAPQQATEPEDEIEIDEIGTDIEIPAEADDVPDGEPSPVEAGEDDEAKQDRVTSGETGTEPGGQPGDAGPDDLPEEGLFPSGETGDREAVRTERPGEVEDVSPGVTPAPEISADAGEVPGGQEPPDTGESLVRLFNRTFSRMISVVGSQNLQKIVDHSHKGLIPYFPSLESCRFNILPGVETWLGEEEEWDDRMMLALAVMLQTVIKACRSQAVGMSFLDVRRLADGGAPVLEKSGFFDYMAHANEFSI